MEYQFEYVVFIGRFQPFHFGHLTILKKAFDIARNVIVLIGSANSPVTQKNPWTSQERWFMIKSSLMDDPYYHPILLELDDFPGNDDLWAQNVREKVKEVTQFSDNVALVGHDHDASSFYLKMFPEWDLIEMGNYDEFPHATQLRKWYFDGGDEWKKFVHKNVAVFLENFKKDQFLKLTEIKNNLSNEKMEQK